MAKIPTKSLRLVAAGAVLALSVTAVFNTLDQLRTIQRLTIENAVLQAQLIIRPTYFVPATK